MDGVEEVQLLKVAAMPMVPIPTPDVLWRKPPELASSPRRRPRRLRGDIDVMSGVPRR